MTRARPADDRLMPATAAVPAPDAAQEAAPEARIFDKAEKAESIESLRQRREEIAAQLVELEGATSDHDLQQVERLKKASESLKSIITESEKRISKDR